jgi:dTDP-4-amino-4,6-dideoxygalactose transaminase
MNSPNRTKYSIDELAEFGGSALFGDVISTSNLVRPDFDLFMSYSKLFYEKKQYTNNGPLVRMLEARLAKFHDTQFCITFANGFWAIVLAIKCLVRSERIEVIMPSLTYRRLADIAAWTGLKPRFCEVDRDTLAMDTNSVMLAANDETALILAVHPIINCCDAFGLEQVSRTCGIPLLFDSVESVYETLAGKKIGSFGNAECFSLHASKLINGFEGGYVTTNDATLAKRLSLMRGFGFSGPDNIVEFGINAKLNEMHAAMALACLDDLEDQVRRNRLRYRAYEKALADLSGIRLLRFNENEKTSYKNIVVELTETWPLSRDFTLRLLHAEGALARSYYAPPLHRKPMLYPSVPATLPVTDELAEKFMLLPSGHFVELDDVQTIGNFLKFISDNSHRISERMRE